jgi:MFS transporter, putative metabolite:H+ symporter
MAKGGIMPGAISSAFQPPAATSPNLGKFIGPAGLAVIIGVSNYVNPKATLAGIVPGFNYFAAWYVLAVVAYLLIGIETRGRTIEEIDATLTRPKPLPAASSS